MPESIQTQTYLKKVGNFIFRIVVNYPKTTVSAFMASYIRDLRNSSHIQIKFPFGKLEVPLASKPFKVTVKCNPKDIFDPLVGETIAINRSFLKYDKWVVGRMKEFIQKIDTHRNTVGKNININELRGLPK